MKRVINVMMFAGKNTKIGVGSAAVYMEPDTTKVVLGVLEAKRMLVEDLISFEHQCAFDYTTTGYDVENMSDVEVLGVVQELIVALESFEDREEYLNILLGNLREISMGAMILGIPIQSTVAGIVEDLYEVGVLV